MQQIINQMNKNNIKTLSEVYSIFEGLQLLLKLPKEIQQLLKDNYNEEYKIHIYFPIPLYEHNLSEDTANMIAYLYTKYICNNQNEKEKLIKKYKENEIEYNRKLQEKYNVDNLFRKSK